MKTKSRYGSVTESCGLPASYAPGSMKLPRISAGAVDLVDSLDAPLRSMLATGSGILRETDEVLPPVRQPAVDATFKRSPQLYGSFLGELFDASIIEIAEGDLGRCGSFMVLRKDLRHRLIFDPVDLNVLCKTPWHCALPSAATISSVECQAGSQLHLKTGDVEVCFYQFHTPIWVRNRMCMVPIKLRHCSSSIREAFAHLSLDTMVTFRVRVLPMGWTWSVVLVTRALQARMASICRSPLGL